MLNELLTHNPVTSLYHKTCKREEFVKLYIIHLKQFTHLPSLPKDYKKTISSYFIIFSTQSQPIASRSSTIITLISISMLLSTSINLILYSSHQPSSSFHSTLQISTSVISHFPLFFKCSHQLPVPTENLFIS